MTQLAHEATLQNIRYLKNLIEESNEDLWLQTINMNMMLNKTVESLQNKLTETHRNNSITNFIQSSIDPAEIELLYKQSDGTWAAFNGSIEIDKETKMYSLSVDTLTTPGHYTILVRPKRILRGINQGTFSVATDLTDVVKFTSTGFSTAENEYYNYTVEFLGGDGLLHESLVTSNHTSSEYSYFRLSPMIGTDITPTSFQLYKNSFIPITIDVEITNHSDDTIGYAMYGRKEFNAATGKVIIYDDNGNEFAEYTVGKETDETKDLIEFRRKATHS